jgi:uncharacterized paraquat-inducible protein A
MPREKRATFIDERIRRCRHCGAEMETNPLSYEENPYCVRCFDERTRTATAPGELAWTPRGHYIEFFKKAT